MPSSSSEAAAAAYAAQWEREGRALGRVPLVLLAAALAVVGFSYLAGGEDEDAAGAATPQDADNAENAGGEEPGQEVAQADPDPEPETQPGVGAEETVLAASATAQDPGGDDEGEDDGDARTEGEDEGQARAQGEGDAEGPAKDEAGKARPRRPRGASKAKASAPASGEAQPLVAPPVAPPDPTAAIEAAKAEGWMLESAGLLLVFPNEGTAVTWDHAKKVCARRRDAGLTGWRLAQFGELKKLRSARALPSGTWWSATTGPDDAHAHTLAATQAKPHAKAAAAARPLCVHRRP